MHIYSIIAILMTDVYKIIVLVDQLYEAGRGNYCGVYWYDTALERYSAVDHMQRAMLLIFDHESVT